MRYPGFQLRKYSLSSHEGWRQYLLKSEDWAVSSLRVSINSSTQRGVYLVFKIDSRTKCWFLLRTLNIMQIPDSIFGVEFNTNLISKRCSTSDQPTSFDANDIRHNFEFSVQTWTTLTTEEMLVDLSGISFNIPCFRAAGSDLQNAVSMYVGWDAVSNVATEASHSYLEVCSWNNCITCVCRSGPSLTIYTVLKTISDWKSLPSSMANWGGREL